VVVLAVDEEDTDTVRIRGEHGHRQPHGEQQDTVGHHRTLPMRNDPDQRERAGLGDRLGNGWMRGYVGGLSVWVRDFFGAFFDG
jgi:hypothetical protein